MGVCLSTAVVADIQALPSDKLAQLGNSLIAISLAARAPCPPAKSDNHGDAISLVPFSRWDLDGHQVCV